MTDKPKIRCPACAIEPAPDGSMCDLCEGAGIVPLDAARDYVRELRRDAWNLQMEAGCMTRRANALDQQVRSSEPLRKPVAAPALPTPGLAARVRSRPKA